MTDTASWLRDGPVVRRRTIPDRPLPSWPVTALVAGYPVWWALGLSLVVPVLLAGAMLALMVLRRGVVLVPGVLPFIAFCVWVLAGAAMLDAGPRLLGYGARTLHLFAAAVVLVFVVNATRHYTLRRAVTGIVLMWVSVVALGYAALLFPDVRLTTLPGLVLPDSLTANDLVRDTFFPPLAEVQQPWGSPVAFNRPAAPFPYANNWGAAIAVLTPVALAAMALARTAPARTAVLAVLAASLVPLGASSNRGMFLALGVAVAYAGVRLAVRGRWAPLAGLVAVGLAVIAYFLSSGLAESIELRQRYSESTSGRMAVYVETLERTMGSPLFGYGAPRPSETADVSVGTQGWIWMLMFSYGFVGLALFVWFLAGVVIRTWRAPTTVMLFLHSSLVAVCAMIAYYGLHSQLLILTVVIAGLLLRETRLPARGGDAGRPTSTVRSPAPS